MVDLKDLVECHIAKEAQKQKRLYDTKTKSRSFEVGNTLWLHNPTTGKLDAKWEGGWIVKDVPPPTSIRIEHPSTRRTMVVHNLHINSHQHRYLRQGEKSEEQVMQDWEPPSIEHFIVPTITLSNILSKLLIKWRILIYTETLPMQKGLEDHQIATKLEDTEA